METPTCIEHASMKQFLQETCQSLPETWPSPQTLHTCIKYHRMKQHTLISQSDLWPSNGHPTSTLWRWSFSMVEIATKAKLFCRIHFTQHSKIIITRDKLQNKFVPSPPWKAESLLLRNHLIDCDDQVCVFPVSVIASPMPTMRSTTATISMTSVLYCEKTV